jgi:Family of unknown function (DUF5681)
MLHAADIGSRAEDQDDPRSKRPAEASTYKVGNKKPPSHTRFKQGQSGNPKGRPKGRKNFLMEVLEEFRKPVFATINGKPIKVTNNELFAAALVKDGITKGPQAKRLLLSVIHKSEALLEQMEVAKKKVEVEEPFPKFSWTDEQERLYQELESVAAGLPEFGSCPKAEATLMILRNRLRLRRPSGGLLA